MDNPGPRKEIVPLDPDSPEGRQAAEELSEVLARAALRIQRHKNSSKAEPWPPGLRPRLAALIRS